MMQLDHLLGKMPHKASVIVTVEGQTLVDEPCQGLVGDFLFGDYDHLCKCWVLSIVPIQDGLSVMVRFR